MKAVHFGAGNIGRGLIAQIYNSNNMEITFIDTNPDLINQLNEAKKYSIVDIETKNKKEITNFSAILSSEEQKVLKALKEADIISTSVGSNNLKYLKPILTKLSEQDNSIKTIICFENGFRISDSFSKDLDLKNNWQFINASTDRIVPIVENKNLDVFVEEFYEIVLEELSDAKLKLENVIYTKNLDTYILRKLFAVNALHSGIAYLGYKLNVKYIHEAMQLNEVKEYIENLKNLIIAILLKKDNIFSQENLENYFKKIIKRFENPFLNDLVTRVARNPITKISKNERYDLILTEANELKIDLKNKEVIYQTFANILSFNYSKDEQAVLMQKLIKSDLKAFLLEYTNINNEDINTIIKLYN